jgi:peptidoglycan/LPS O-acetylase OafA/YrhL
VGSIRTILAISVVFVHSYGFVFVGGQLAVQLFYITSGYLISFVLTEANTYKKISSFYFNRFLRLLPLYYVVALITILTGMLIAPEGYEVFNIIKLILSIDSFGGIALVFTNILVLGQDWIMFTAIQEGNFQLVTNFRNSEIPIYSGLIIPQAWTLGVELSFYLIAPFVLKRLNLIIILLIISILIRVYLYYIGLGLQDPWSYRFFPTELAFFLFGSLSHQIWKPYLLSRGILNKKLSLIAVCVVMLYCILFFLLPHREISALILFLLFTCALPLLFNFQLNNKWDALIGELSYPIYISHMLIITLVNFILKKIFNVQYEALTEALIIVICSIMFSLFLNVTVGKIISKARMKVKTNQ